MRKKMLAAVAVFVIALAALFAYNASPASAHIESNLAAFNCAATRVTEEHTLVHAHDATFGVYSNGVAYYRATCYSRAEDVRCNWVVEMRSWGGVNQTFVFSGPRCVIV